MEKTVKVEITKETIEKMYTMKCLDVLTLYDFNNATIFLQRVPGGWMYCLNAINMCSTTFIPMNSEFEPRKSFFNSSPDAQN